VSAQTETLGGRLPLLEPSALLTAQKETYERLNRTWIPWANDVPFQSKLEDGRLIGPFNPILFSPSISSSFLDLQETEQNDTSLSQRVRQVVILAVGAVWKSSYELYAHAAAAGEDRATLCPAAFSRASCRRSSVQRSRACFRTAGVSRNHVSHRYLPHRLRAVERIRNPSSWLLGLCPLKDQSPGVYTPTDKKPLCTSELTQIRTTPPASLSSLQAGMMGDDFCIDKMLGRIRGNPRTEYHRSRGAGTEPEQRRNAKRFGRPLRSHNEFGMGIIVSDEKLSAVSRGLGANISGCEIWSTNSMPVDNSMEAEASQRAGFVKKYNYVGSGQGTTVRIVERTPGHAMFWHRTETLDYSMVLSGEIDVKFDSGQVVTMKQGDIIVMRGVTHCWKNKSTIPAVTAFILIDAVPFEAAGEKRGVLFPA
jgi:quercetin dioxygenase-like cupin family protein